MRESWGVNGRAEQLPHVVRAQVSGLDCDEAQDLTVIAQASGNGITDAEIDAPLETVVLVQEDRPDPFADKHVRNG